jgi:hypothetical protein
VILGPDESGGGPVAAAEAAAGMDLVLQAFREPPSPPVCASCGAEFRADGEGLLVMAHPPTCSQMQTMVAQARGMEADDVR